MNTIPVSKARLWTGRILSGLIGLLMLVTAATQITLAGDVAAQSARYGYLADDLRLLGVALALTAILYVVPGTQVLGAILLTGYFGGAIGTHVSHQEPFVPAVVMGVLVWVSLWLRDPRIHDFARMRVRV
ncbi:MAG: DoxX family protein [Acidobacteria bacterium]|nr:DoxX family protein [Acidobacteriota bacterium]